MQQIAYIMRGIPGSGKSTIAKLLAGNEGTIHSTDEYFVVNGEYQFVPSKLKEYHALNREAFSRDLRDGVPVVVCDNTNVRHWEYQPYEEAAIAWGYKVVYVVLPHPTIPEAVARNTHGVPEFAIRRMLDRWEA